MKKVLGLIVSDRKLGNSELLVKEIMSNIPEICELELLRLIDLRIKSCKACYKCLMPDSRCRIDDDFNFIINKVMQSDALIIGVPVYSLGPHAYLKLLMDRMLGAGKFVEHTRNKPCILVIPFGKSGMEGYSKTAALVLPRLLEMKVVDCWLVNAALPGESLINQENLDYAKNLGSNLFMSEDFNKGARECQQCGADLFRIKSDGSVECPLCGNRGFLTSDNTLDFSSSSCNYFSFEHIEEHFSWLLNMKKKFLQEKASLHEIQKRHKDKEWWIRPN